MDNEKDSTPPCNPYGRDKMGHGGDALMSQVTGLHVATIRRGRQELDADLQGRPSDRIRLPGGGRPRVEKKTLRSKRT